MPQRKDTDHDTSRRDAGPEHPELYNGLPSATNRSWGEDRADPAYTYGQEGLGGYGDFTQGGYGERQGRHAQSGHGRGGSQFRDGEFQERQARGFRGRGPQGYVRPDERIRDDIIDRLTDDPQLDASEILLMIEDGVVTLTGNVPERRMKHRAEDIAAEATGVRDVRNEIRVDNGAASFGRPGEAIRSGNDQLGSAFSSSARPDPVWDNVPEDSNWHPGPPTRHG